MMPHSSHLQILSGSVCFFVSFHFLPLNRVRVAGARALAGTSRHSSPRLHPPTLPGGHRDVPRPAQRYNLSSMSWVCSWMGMPKIPPQGDVQEASWADALTTSTDSSRRGGAAVLLWASPGRWFCLYSAKIYYNKGCPKKLFMKSRSKPYSEI